MHCTMGQQKLLEVLNMQKAIAHQNQNSLQSEVVKNKIRWLRISYWVGAILDGLYVIPMVVPQWAGALFGAPNFPTTPEIRYVFNVGAALMAGWTALLIWADRKPVERRGVLLLTLFPVKVGLDLASIALGLSGAMPLSRLLISKIDSVGLWVLYTYSYLNSRDLAKGGAYEH